MKNKKKLNDKEREALKKKYRHIGKIVLDILMYGFAIIMAIALAVGGACSYKQANAVYYGERYTNYNQLNVNELDKYNLYMPITDNYKYIIPDYATISQFWYDCGSPSETTIECVLNESVYINNYRVVGVYFRRGVDSTSAWYRLGLVDINDAFIHTFIIRPTTIYTVDTTGVSCWNAVFNGTHKLFRHEDNYNFLSKFLLFYGSTNSYKYVEVEMPFNDTKSLYPYLIDNQNGLNDNFAFNGYAFYSDYFYSTLVQNHESDTLVARVPFISGSFYCAGRYFSAIELVISPIFRGTNTSDWIRSYYLNGTNTGITSANENYNHYFYVSSIRYGFFNGGFIEACSISTSIGSTSNVLGIDLDNFYWLGTDVNNGIISPYRTFTVHYILNASMDIQAFPLLEGYSYIELLNSFAIVNDLPMSTHEVIDTIGDYPVLSVFDWLRRALIGVLPLFSLSFLPGLTLGTVLLLPFAVMVILFVVKLFKR